MNAGNRRRLQTTETVEDLLIEFKNVTKRFGKQTVLDNVDLQIHDGHVTTIIGKSGTGKSVLLKHIVGFLSPSEGMILFRGKPIDRMDRNEFDAFRNQFSYCIQNNALFDSLLDDFDALLAKLGQSRADDIVQSLAKYVNRHFGDVGISYQVAKNQFGAVLNQTNAASAKSILESFAQEIRKYGFAGSRVHTEGDADSNPSLCFVVFAGLVEGNPREDIQIAAARAKSKR